MKKKDCHEEGEIRKLEEKLRRKFVQRRTKSADGLLHNHWYKIKVLWFDYNYRRFLRNVKHKQSDCFPLLKTSFQQIQQESSLRGWI